MKNGYLAFAKGEKFDKDVSIENVDIEEILTKNAR